MCGYFTKNPLGTFWKCPLLTCWVWARQIDGHFLKTINTYLLGISLGKLVSTFQMCPLFTCWVWAGQMGGYFLKCPPFTSWVRARQIVSEPTMNSQCTHWVYCPLPPVCTDRRWDHFQHLCNEESDLRYRSPWSWSGCVNISDCFFGDLLMSKVLPHW